MRAILVMGVAGSGKTSLARALASLLARPFVEGDDLHAEAARAKMARGQALTDADRAPWLDRIAARLAHGDGLVLSCSALKRAYRDRLRQSAAFDVVYCAITPEEASRRLVSRAGHFFPPELLPSQFAALEPPKPDEHAYVADAALTPDENARRAKAHFGW